MFGTFSRIIFGGDGTFSRIILGGDGTVSRIILGGDWTFSRMILGLLCFGLRAVLTGFFGFGFGGGTSFSVCSRFRLAWFRSANSALRRAASSIAEGYGRQSTNEYIRFLHISLGSLRELDTQLIIAQRVKLANNELFIPMLNEVEQLQKIMVTTLKKLKV